MDIACRFLNGKIGTEIEIMNFVGHIIVSPCDRPFSEVKNEKYASLTTNCCPFHRMAAKIKLKLDVKDLQNSLLEMAFYRRS